MQRLFIAEKPSVANAIANELGITKKSNGYIECGSDVVTWCFGHMLELAQPDRYTPDDVPMIDGKKIWRQEDLPIIPKEWILEPKADTKSQLDQINKLIPQASTLVNCGDPDREGQNLINEIIDLHKTNVPTLRYWSSGIDQVSVKRALDSLFDNTTKKCFGDASIARQRADWLIGMNLSRAFTLRAQRAGSRALITVGRVQTPVLSIVVNRDREIENFTPIAYHTLKANLCYEDSLFTAKWKAREDQIGLDTEGRLINTDVADNLIASIAGNNATVLEAKSVSKKVHHPLAFSLSNLTVLASKKFGYTAQSVLDICQNLYEKHKLTSYPRSDCGYLPLSQLSDAKSTLAAIKVVNPEFSSLVDAVDLSIKSKTWDDSKVTAHHGIIPTQEVGNINSLSDEERNIYDIIVRTYIAQFYPIHQYQSTTIGIDIAGESFTSTGKVITINGWKDVFIDNDSNNDDQDKDGNDQALPNLQTGDDLICNSVERRDARTKPPSNFTEGTLVAAMIGIYKYVDDSASKKLLREEDGLGTEATRASIISELKRREYLVIKGKNIVSTTLGRSIVDALPTMVKSPVLTALFERMLKSVETGEMTLDEFVTKQETFIREQVDKASVGSVKIAGSKSMITVSEIYKCTVCNHGLSRRPTSVRGRYWWGCSNYPTCTQMYQDTNGKPNYSKPIKPKEPTA